ncbi:MAG: hypothetical protein ACI3XC_04155, partial [Phascolarctobacterium sp.]
MKKTFIFGKKWKKHLATAITAGLLAGVYAPSVLAFDSVITGTDADSEYKDAEITSDYRGYTFTEEESIVPGINFNQERVTYTVNASSGLTINGTFYNNAYNGFTYNGSRLDVLSETGNAMKVYGSTNEIKGDLSVDSGGNGIVIERLTDTNNGSESPAKFIVNGTVDVKASEIGISLIGGSFSATGLVNIAATGDALDVKDNLYKSWWNTYGKSGEVSIVGGVLESESGNAIKNQGSAITVNGSGDKDVVLVGDITQKAGGASSTANTTVKLNSASSSWTGNLYNESASNLYLTLANGATWTDKVTDSTLDNTMASLTGGADAASAGNIFRNDTRDLTINNYSGFTNIYYEHGAVENNKTTFTAGNTIIKSASEGSQITLLTQQEGVDKDNADELEGVLSSLAGRLYYSGYVNDETNLTAKVGLAETLTQSSAIANLTDVNFDFVEGQGYVGEAPIPDHQVKTSLESAITGGTDADYVYAGILKDDGSYIFTKNTTITTTGAGINTGKDVTINAEDNTLKIVASALKGINNSGGTQNITGNLDIKVTSTGDNDGSAGIYVKNATTNVTGDVNIVAHSESGAKYAIWGISANENGNIIIDGNVTMNTSDGWAVDNGNSGLEYSGSVNKGAAGIEAYKGSAKITGDVNLKVNGVGVLVDWADSSNIDILGGGYIEVNKDITQDSSNNLGSYALETSAGGHIAMNYDRENDVVGNS